MSADTITELAYTVAVTEIDRERDVRYADYDWPYGDEFVTDGAIRRGDLYRELAKEFGRCTGKVFVDADDGGARQVGWVFVKREPYPDAPSETYLQETWVSVRAKRPAVPVPVDLGGRP